MRCAAIRRDGRPCKASARNGTEFCGAHSADPPAGSRANLKKGAAVPANQHLTRVFSIEPSALMAKVEDIGGQVLMRDDDGSVPSHLRRTVQGAARIELELDWLGSKPSLTARDERRREGLEKRLDAHFERLGMSYEARIRSAPLQREQEIAKLRRTHPNRTDPLHAKQALGVAMRSGVFNEPSMKWAAEQDPDGNGRTVLLTEAEKTALQPAATEVAAEPVTPVPLTAVNNRRSKR